MSKLALLILVGAMGLNVIVDIVAPPSSGPHLVGWYGVQ
jgi:hypothetical protein